MPMKCFLLDDCANTSVLVEYDIFANRIVCANELELRMRQVVKTFFCCGVKPPGA